MPTSRASVAVIPALTASTRWSAEEARAVLAACQRSGLTIHAFARQHDLDPQRLYFWQRRFTADRLPPAAFVEVATPRPIAPERYELGLCSGRTLSVDRAFDDATLRRLIVVLETP